MVKMGWMLAALSAFLIILDQAVKRAAAAYLPLNHSIPVIDGIFDLTLTYNTGASFGIFKGMNTLFIFISIIVLIGLYVFREDLAEHRYAAAFIVAGVIGNLLDRIMLGYVIDFADFRIWPIFNVADACISCGIAYILIKTLIKEIATSRRRRTGTRPSSHRA
jgi:signal peptidase II